MTPVMIALLLLTTIICLLLAKLWRLSHPPASTSLTTTPFAQLDSSLVADALCEGYFDVDLNSGHYQVSDHWLSSTGYQRDQLPAQMTDMLRLIVHADHIDSVLSAIEQAVESRSSEKIIDDFRLKHADGHLIWMHGMAQLVFDSSGKPIRLLASHSNVSEVKNSEQSLLNGQILAGLREYYFDLTTSTLSLGPQPIHGTVVKRADQWQRFSMEKMAHQDDIEKIMAAIKAAQTSGQPLETEFRIVTPTDQVRIVRVFGQLDTNAAGVFIGVRGVCRDITEQRRKESRYVEFGKLLEESRTGLVITRISDLSTLFVNQTFCADSGFSQTEALSKSANEFLKDWSSEQIKALFLSLKNSQTGSSDQIHETGHVWRKNGTAYPADAWTQLTQWQGETAIATMILDISEREQIQQALKRSEQKYRLLFDALPDGVALISTDSMIIDCNQELAASHGWHREELIGKPTSLLITENSVAQQIELIEEVTKFGSFVKEGTDRHRDGSQLFFEAHGRALTLDEEPLVVCVLRDVTERHRYIHELKQQKVDIEQFTFSISHDLKSPLITIEGFAEILAENLENMNLNEAKHDLQRISSAAGKMHLLLTELLEYSRLGMAPKQAEKIAMNEIIQDSLDRVAGQVAAAGATIATQADLPVISGNPGQLAQLYQNLIDNAIKFSRDGHPANIELGWEPAEACFFVDDNGCGIPAGYQEKVFSLFDQLDPEQAGSGIGLATAKRIVEAHGGKIWLQSPSPLGGTKFCFTLKNQ